MKKKEAIEIQLFNLFQKDQQKQLEKEMIY